MTIATFDPAQTSGDELRRSYIDSGYVLVTGLVDEAARAEITRELRRINRGDYSRSPIEGVTWRDEIEPVDWPEDDERLIGRHMYLGQPHVYSAVVRDAMTHSGICRVLDHVVGACVQFWDGAYKCMQSMFVVEPPGGSGSPWHQDEHPIPTRDRSLTGVWIALTDATVANGCLWILPDSHKSGVIHERYAHDLPDVDSNPVARGFDETGAIPIEMTAGSVLFFSGYLLHSSHKNQSDSYRPALTFHYCSASDVADLGRRAELPRRRAGTRGGSLCRPGVHHAAALGEGAIAGPRSVGSRLAGDFGGEAVGVRGCRDLHDARGTKPTQFTVVIVESPAVPPDRPVLVTLPRSAQRRARPAATSATPWTAARPTGNPHPPIRRRYRRTARRRLALPGRLQGDLDRATPPTRARRFGGLPPDSRCSAPEPVNFETRPERGNRPSSHVPDRPASLSERSKS